MSLGDRIRRARKNAKLTQAELAQRSGVATITIHQYESGKRQPRMKQLQSIADALGVSVDSLTSEKTNIFPGLDVTQTDHPDSDYFAYQFDADSPEKLLFMLDTLKEKGVFQQVLTAELQKLNGLGQCTALNLVQQLAQHPEYVATPKDE